MAPKMRSVRMDRDDLAWERSDEEVESWEKSLHNAELYRSIADLIMKYKPGQAVRLHTPIRGGYNICYQLEYSDGTSAAMRIPSKGILMHILSSGSVGTKSLEALSSSLRRRFGTR